MRLFKNADLRAKRRFIIAIALICLALLAYVDWLTGPSVSVICFYLIPIFLLSWFGGWRLGLIVAGLHAATWLAIDYEWLPHHSAVIFWNAIVRFVTFAGVVWLVQLCKNLTGEVERLAIEKNDSLTREVQTRAASEEAIRHLANQLSAAEDVERRRLGQELHDSLGQSLTLLKLRLEGLAAGMSTAQSKNAGMDESVALLASIINQARTLTFELYPTMLDQLGLTAALTHYARQLAAQTKTNIHVSDSGPDTPLPMPTAGFLFRAVKELMSNALKHGLAREIVLQIRRSQGAVRIVVTDDGNGFDPQKIARPGLGLAWIRERVHSLGGTLDIDSAPAKGARLSIDLPLHARSEPPVEALPDGQLAPG